MSKSSNYRIRVEPDLHQEFLNACKAHDRPAAQIIREFMKSYVMEYRQGLQTELFVAEERETYDKGKK